MTNGINEENPVDVSELVILSKFEGDPEPENEFERVTIKDGTIIAHEQVENGEVVGPVTDSDIVGAEIGTLTVTDKEVE